MFTSLQLIAILIVIFIIVCIWHYRLCHQDGRESLNCNCSRLEAAQAAWDPNAKLKPCPTRYIGNMPYRHPNAACASPVYNPFWPPFGSAGSFMPTSESRYIEVPISRMIGDHVPPE